MTRFAPFTLPAPAKLNLFLHITGRRADGYHELQTLFQFLDFGDTLRFAPADDLRLHSPAPLAVSAADNLVLAAARALQLASGCRQGAAIELEKQLPIGGGVGGGSSDAATTLLGLNQAWGLGLASAELAAIGLQLGADVPVFVHGHAAWAEGVGERLTPVAPAEPAYLVVFPAIGVPTAAVFSDLALTRNSPVRKISALVEPGMRNDCEPVVRRLCPEVGRALDWLNEVAGHQAARLTGTGACVFAAFASMEAARAAQARIPAPWSGFVAQGCNRSPAHVALERLRAESGQR